MGKRLIELNTCREDFTDWQIDWNFPKPQSFLLLFLKGFGFQCKHIVALFWGVGGYFLKD